MTMIALCSCMLFVQYSLNLGVHVTHKTRSRYWERGYDWEWASFLIIHLWYLENIKHIAAMGYDCQCMYNSCNYFHRLRSEPHSWNRAASWRPWGGQSRNWDPAARGEGSIQKWSHAERVHQLMVDEGVISRMLHVGGPRAMSSCLGLITLTS